AKDSNGRWGVRGIALLGPTMTGGMASGGSLNDQWERIMDELLLGGSNIYWLDDDTLQEPEFSSYTAPPGCTGVLYKARRPDLVHYQNPEEGITGTNTSSALRDEVLNWFGTVP